MNNISSDKLQASIEFINHWVEEELLNEKTGHDYYHIMRVMNTALVISEAEVESNSLKVKLLSLCHDMSDYKLFNDVKKARFVLLDKLKESGLSEKEANEILSEIELIGFKGSGKNTPKTIEGKIVQDADRLDAIGAIGVARAFAYGGSKKRFLYDPKKVDQTDTLSHFDEKLLKLKDLMNTKKGSEIAQERHHFLQYFKTQFLNEWNATDV